MKTITLLFEKAGWLPVTVMIALSSLGIFFLLASFNTRRSSGGLNSSIAAVIVIGILAGIGIYSHLDWSNSTKELVNTLHEDDIDIPKQSEIISQKMMTAWAYGFPAGLFTLLFLLRSIIGIMKK